MPNNQDFDQFEDLIDELQRSDERPYPPRAFKNQLRSNLLNQYDQPRFSLANLGRLAGTAVGFAVLTFIVIYAWNSMSPSRTTGAPVEVTRPVQPTPAPTISPVEPEVAAASFRDGPLLNRHTLSATQVNPGDTVDVTLFWEGKIAPNSQVALHLTDASGVLFSQSDQPLTAEMALSLPIPETLADGVYEIVVIKYDGATSARQDSFLLQEIGVGTAVANPERSPNDVWLIAATQRARTSVDDPITLEITVGYQFDMFDEEETVTLKPLYAHPEWETAVGGRMPLDGLGDEIVLDGKSGTHTFIFSESPTLMRDVVGTDYPVLVMQLAYLAEDELGNLHLNILAMPTLTGFVIDLKRIEEMQYFAIDSTAIISGTDDNGLTLRSDPGGQMLGTLEEGSLVFLLNEPLQESKGLFWQLVRTPDGLTGWVAADFLDYPEGYTPTETMPLSPNSLWIVNATQLPRSDPNEAITLEITVGYELVTAEEAVLSVSFIYPEWETRTSLDEIRYPNFNALGEQYPVQAGTGSVTLTATIEPETITSAISSDEFGLMTRLWATDENGRLIFNPILMGFDKRMTFNLQTLEEITYP